ncbi:hypothetical protein [Tepidibacillus marianensis]|uniref:hypothetical protein n=1 Tax=Tepidibacillus marianensis TaxID=3131995 RepID=UPI0030CBB941
MILYNNTTYVAKPETPDEFVDKGVFLIREPYKVPAGKSRPIDYKKEMPTNNDPRSSSGTPAAPGKVSVNGSVVSWTKNTNANIVGYRIYRASADGVGFAKIGIVRQTDNGGGIYTYKDSAGGGQFAYYVTSIDVGGLESSPSEIAGKPQQPNPTDPNAAVPQKPTGMNVMPQGGQIAFSWNPNPDQDQVQNYYVYYSDSKNGNYQLIYQGIKTSFNTSIPDVKTAYYYVIAENANGKSGRADLEVKIK